MNEPIQSTETDRSLMTFPALNSVPGLVHGFTIRESSESLRLDGLEAREHLQPFHQKNLAKLGIDFARLTLAEQVHGSEIAFISSAHGGTIPGVDALATTSRNVPLGIYAADCCVVYLVEPSSRFLSLVHSGKKGTQLNIVGKVIREFASRSHISPSEIIAQLSPCICAECYDMDIPAQIVEQLREAGINCIHASGFCTSCSPNLFYSYRAESGKTGRMLAFSMWR